ncbi:J domain-containing protein [Shimia marina]|uniref:Chaperone protein DnaJ n=1 Tax=Shimia marina TaxID=321267 RepID=A0A0P1FBA4_9RHOB|nr:J domain-containing protein [Shimia marina]CUH51245.1 chaperone protein DnaJ [Shimia marina]SFD54120.1 DnaJ domain-containing protein [Shimia marina]
MSPEIERAYRLLDVTPDVSEKEMRSAWRKLVRRYHPDLAKTDPEEASRRMGEINAAFDALTHHRSQQDQKPPRNPKRRKAAQAPKETPAPPRTARTYKAENGRTQTTAKRKTARTTERKRTQEAPKREAAPHPRRTHSEQSAKWSLRDQELVNAARARFEETRENLSSAARRPTYSVCR